MLPKPGQSSQRPIPVNGASVLTHNKALAAACGVFGIPVLPNRIEEIRKGDTLCESNTYRLGSMAMHSVFGEFRTRRVIADYESGTLWETQPNHPFLFAMAAILSLDNLRRHCHSGESVITAPEHPPLSSVHSLEIGQRIGSHEAPKDEDILRTDKAPVLLAAVACGAAFYPELTSPSGDGLYWFHFARMANPFEPHKNEVQTDMRRALEDPNQYPRLGIAIGAVRSFAEIDSWSRRGTTYLFRDKPLKGQVSNKKGIKSDRRKHAYVPEEMWTGKEKDKIRKHLLKNR